MADDRKIDPTNADFVTAAGGAFEQCDAIENQIAFSLLIERGTWEGDPDLGQEFAELARAQDTTENLNRLKDLAAKAVQWLVDAGRLDHIETSSESLGGGAVAFELDYYLPGTANPKRTGPFVISVGGG